MVISFIIRFYFTFIYPNNITQFEESLIDPLFRISHPDYEKLVATHIMLLFIGIGLITLAIEHYVYKKTHKILAILIFLTAPLLVVVPYEIAVKLQIIPILITIISIIIMVGVYLNLAWKSTGTIRWKSTYIAVGFLLFFGGIMLNSQTIMDAIDLLTINLVWVVPIWFMVALLVLFYGYKKE